MTRSGKPLSALRAAIERGGTLSARFLKTRSRAAQQQSATSMTNDGQKRGVRMTGPQKVMIWLGRCTPYGGCLRFCGFRPSNRRLFPLFSSPLSVSFSIPPPLSLSISYCCAQTSSISRFAAVYDLLNDSDAFSRTWLNFVSSVVISRVSFHFVANAKRIPRPRSQNTTARNNRI